MTTSNKNTYERLNSQQRWKAKCRKKRERKIRRKGARVRNQILRVKERNKKYFPRNKMGIDIWYDRVTVGNRFSSAEANITINPVTVTSSGRGEPRVLSKKVSKFPLPLRGFFPAIRISNQFLS